VLRDVSQCAETTTMARGRPISRPQRCSVRVKRLSCTAFIGEP
jgi:hypothetical protein